MENAALRAGPRPYHLHLFTTACMLSAAAWPMAADPDKRNKVISLVGDLTADMMRGLDAYRASPAQAQRRQHPVIWQDGTTRLLRVEGAEKNAVPVLLVMMAIERVGPALTAQTGMVGPIATIAMGVWLLGEPFSALLAAGTVLVVAGIYVFTRAPTPTP